jgi:hypothetical protein
VGNSVCIVINYGIILSAYLLGWNNSAIQYIVWLWEVSASIAAIAMYPTEVTQYSRLRNVQPGSDF